MKVGNCWANIDKKEGSLNSKVNIYFDENDTGANRSVKIRVSSRDGSVSEECTVVHKKKEQVVYRNKRQSALFTKEGCNPETEKGEELEYVVEAGKYTSIISQSDADDKAMRDIEQNGQNWVNEHGRCITILWYNVKKSKSFRKNDCDPDTEEGSLVTMTFEAGQFSSFISQEDADRRAEAELNAKGQDYANSHGTCNTIKWYNDRKSKMFQKTDCEVTEVGSMVEYVVEAGRFSSSVSKEDANQKALEALEAEGPGYANEHGTCETNLWYNVEKSKVFYKNDCEDGFIGAPYTYTVEAGKYTSDVSQEDADQKALDDIEKNGQDQANLNGECVTDPNYFVGKASARVQKNDCDAESQTGSFVDLTEKDLAGYPDAFVSRESQEAANALAQAAMEEQKQDLANKKGTCIDKNQFVGVYSKVFTKDNCDGEGVGSQVTVDQDDVTGGPFTSYESQEAANALAQAAVEQQGQAIANRDGHCTWTGKYSEEFTKNDCNEGQVGSKITVTEQDVVGAPFTSTVSQDDANNKAKAAVKEQGQAIANSKGNCENMTVYTGHYSKRFVPECKACHKGVEMEVTAEMVNGGPVTSTESQDAADAEARRIVEEGGQAYVNKNGNCTPLSTDPVWEGVVPEELRCNEGKSQKKQRDTNECSETHNQERWVDGGNKVCSWTGHYTETFQKNDCEIPDSGTEVEVSEADVEGNPFTSFVSQEDADNKAKEAVKAQGQAIANQKGKCRFVGVYSKQFTKDNCGSCHHGVPMSVTQDMVGGPFYSNESQEEANRLAQAAVEAQGQAYVNKNGTCEMDNTDPVWVDSEPLETKCEGGKSYKKQVNTNECYGGADERWVEGGDKVCTWTGTYSKQFTKQCADGGVGSEVTIDQDDVTGGPFTSYESQEAANALAQAAVEQQGQAIANRDGHCTWTGKYSEEFTKNDCNEGQVGSKITVTEQDVVGAPFTSTVSQDDANNKAKAAVKEQGQAIANSKGNCENMTVYTGHYSKRFVPECKACHKGVEMEVTAEMVNGGPVTSTESQDAADAEARRIVEEGGQAYVNKNGNCTPLSTDPVWEGVVPEELRCNEGKSQKKQRDTNECSETHNQERWVDGGNKVCSWTGHYTETFQKNDCEIPDSGTEVEVSEADVEGNPFTSFVSQEDADNKAKEAVKAQGQAIANQKGKCRFVGVYSKQFTKDNCGSCHHGVPMSVTQDMVGGPFYSNESQEEANRLAQAAVEAQGQAYVNKNGTCEMDNTDPVWVDSEPLETKCEGGKSYKKQVNTNECYGGADERWVEGGDKVCTWTGTYSKQFTKQCADGGVGSEVTIDQDDVTGGPFTSTVSQEDANSKAQAAVEAQGQALADAQGTCTWTGKASKVFTRNNCGSCQHGSSVTVTQDQVGGPFTSNISQADANKKAQDAVNAQGQAVANKNADCLPDSTTPSWSDTGSTRCDGCTSQKQQRDTNPCSSSYNDTRWVNGGGESCTDWTYYGTGDCVGHTQYNAYRDSCSGSIDRQYSVSCRNCCNCGSYGSWQENGCNGTKTKFIRYDDCGNSDTKEEYVIGSCGYAPYEFQFHDGRTSKSWSVTGESQDIKEVIISTKNDSYIGYSVKSKPSWCSVDYRDQTSESMKAVVTLSANTTSSSRSGDIVFVQNESGKTVTLSITQDVAVTYEFSTNQSTWNADANGGANNSYLCIQLKSKKNGSKIGYAVSSKPSWVTEVTEKPSGVSCPVLSGYDYSFVIISSANSSSSSRSGTVTLKQNESGKTVNITVNQEGKAEAKPVPAHIALKNGSWATYRKNNVSYNPGAGKCIAGFEWTGDENGNIRIYTCDIKVVDANYREISGATISIGTTTQRRQSGSSCSYFGAVNGGILAGYVHSGDENGYTTWYIRTINVSYKGKVYKTATVRQYEKQNISKKGGVFNVYNESPASYNFIVDGAECGDENGTLKYAYSQMDLNPA